MKLLGKIYGHGDDLDVVLNNVVKEYNVRKQEDPSVEFRDIQVYPIVNIISFHVVLVYEYSLEQYIGEEIILRKKESADDYFLFQSRIESGVLKS